MQLLKDLWLVQILKLWMKFRTDYIYLFKINIISRSYKFTLNFITVLLILSSMLILSKTLNYLKFLK